MVQARPYFAVALLLASCTHGEALEPAAEAPGVELEAPAGVTNEAAEPASESPTVELEAPASVPDPEQRLALIRAEVEALAGEHPWAGVYSSSHVDAGIILAVAPRNGWVEQHSGIRGRYFSGAGDVKEMGGWLSFEQDGSVANARLPPKRLPIAWGERRFLLFEGDQKSWLNAVNSGSKRSQLMSGQCSTRPGANPTGRPQLPPDMAKSVFDPPLSAKMLRVDFGSESDSEPRNRHVEFDVGRSDGVFIGMRLYPTGPDSAFFYLTVTAVDEHTCEAALTSWRASDPIAPGVVYSSALPKHLVER